MRISLGSHEVPNIMLVSLVSSINVTLSVHVHRRSIGNVKMHFYSGITFPWLKMNDTTKLSKKKAENSVNK